MSPKSFFPCFAPLPRVSVVGTPSSNSRTWASRLKRTQWTQVPRGASGSSQIRAMLLVPDGGSDQRNGGDRSAPSPVYCFGILVSALNAVLVTSIDIGESPLFVSFDEGLHPRPRYGTANISKMQDFPGMAATTLRLTIMASRSCTVTSPSRSGSAHLPRCTAPCPCGSPPHELEWSCR